VGALQLDAGSLRLGERDPGARHLLFGRARGVRGFARPARGLRGLVLDRAAPLAERRDAVAAVVARWPRSLDAWARDANALERLVPTCNGAYCLQGPADANGAPTLSRNWELGRFASAGRNSAPDPARPAVGVGLHAWEGGSGYPDCLCASRGLPPFGTTYRAWLCYSLSDGWIA